MTSFMSPTAEGRALRQGAFLKALAAFGNYAEASRESGVAYPTQKEWRKDEEFAAKCAEAIALFQASLHKEIVKRGRDGFEEPVLDKNGRPIYRYDPETGKVMLDDNLEPMIVTRKVRSDQLLLAAAEAHVPSYGKKRGGMAVGMVADPDGEGALPTKITIEFVDAEDGKPKVKASELDDPLDS